MVEFSYNIHSNLGEAQNMKIKAPTNCPSCDSELDWSNQLLYCINKQCSSQVEKRIQHFAKTLKIKGLGPASITKLQLDSLEDIYTLTVDSASVLLGSQKLAEKLMAEIENSKSAMMNTLLAGFSIPLIGRSASEKLSITCDTIFDINEDNCKLAGIGPKATSNLLQWLDTDLDLISDLPFNWTFTKKKQIFAAKATRGVVCISGKLTSYKTKAQAAEALTEAGYEVVSTVSNKCNYLVNESGIESAKTQKARNNGIQIILNLKDFL